MNGPTYAVLALCIVPLYSMGHGDEALTTLLGDHWHWFLGEFPEFATRKGYTQWNSARESYNISAYIQRKDAIRTFLGRLKTINRDHLSSENQLSYDILEDNFQTYLDGFKWFRYGAINPVVFVEGTQFEYNRVASGYNFSSKQNFDDYIRRIVATRQQLQEIMELCREAIRLGRTLNAVSVTRVPGQIDKFLVSEPQQFIVYKPFNETLDRITSISYQDKSELRRRAATAIADNYLDAFRELKAFILNEYIPNTRTAWGVSSWPEGQDYYRACLKWHLSADVTANEIHQLGLSEVHRISEEMKLIMIRQGFNGSIAEYFRYIKLNRDFQMTSTEEVLQTYTDMIHKRIDPHLHRLFRDVPKLPVEVKASQTGGTGSYSRGSPDGSKPGVFWAGARFNQTFSFDMMSLTAHEVNPGHHLQNSYAMQISLPQFRKNSRYIMYSVPFNFPAYTAYKEGWALYSESLIEELGLYKDDYERMGKYSSEIFRACRLVVDTGIHSLGWSRGEAIEYMLNYTSFDRAIVEREIDRYITWPGQACAYKFGELKISSLRKKAEQQMGEMFDVKDFHAVILKLGPAPLYLVERAVNDFIKGMSVSASLSLGPSLSVLLTAVFIISMITLK